MRSVVPFCQLPGRAGVAAETTTFQLAEQPMLFAKLARWLRPGGLLLARLGTGGSNDDVEHWLARGRSGTQKGKPLL